MGASSSTEQAPPEQREAESIASSTGALPILHKSFSKLSDSETSTVPMSSLEKCLSIADGSPICEAPTMPDCFPGLLGHLGPSIVDLFFVPEKGGVSWVEFLRGYVKCCGRMPSSMSLNTLFRVFAAMMTKASLALKLEFESDDDDDCKIRGNLRPTDVQMLLWMCWVMSWHSRTSKVSREQAKLSLPDIDNLVFSAIISCDEMSSDLNFSECNVSALDIQLPVQKVLAWILTTVPCLTDCFVQYVHKRIQESAILEDASEPSGSSSADIPSTEVSNTHLLTQGRAWAISLTLRSTISEEILKACNTEGDKSLVYRSSLHGKGLSRIWSNIEGYQGPSLMLISASSGDGHEDSTNKKWIIGALVHQGYESKDMFYGSSGHLFSLSPIFNVFAPSGKEKNFVYSHLHPTARKYEANPKPVGIAFGGSIGNERVFIDEDFAKISIRHHVGDKTYQSGSLFPDQGYLTVEASISEVEVWGLGGEAAKKMQESFKQREQLFTEQRRAIDLKTFSNWEDSPEKMMMDMVSDPNRVRREER